MTDGDGIFFDGRLWHGTDNRSRSGERLALVLQFAGAGLPVRIPDWSELDRPFRLRDEPRPPVILVRGSDRRGSNTVAPPPPLPPADASPLRTRRSRVRPSPRRSRAGEALATVPGVSRADANVHRHVVPCLRSRGRSLTAPAARSRGGGALDPPARRGGARRPERARSRPSHARSASGPDRSVDHPAWQHHTVRNPGASISRRSDVQAADRRVGRWERAAAPRSSRFEDVASARGCPRAPDDAVARGTDQDASGSSTRTRPFSRRAPDTSRTRTPTTSPSSCSRARWRRSAERSGNTASAIAARARLDGRRNVGPVRRATSS